RYARSSSSCVTTSRQRSDHSRASARQSSRSSTASDGETAVAASACAGPSVSLATQATNALSAPPLNATTTDPSSRRRSRSTVSSAIEHLDPDPLVALALRLGLHDADAADLVGAADMGAAVGLLVETDDVHDADLLDRLGDEVDLGADQVLVLHRSLPRQERDLDRSRRRELVVHQLLDASAEALGQRVELEVHPGAERLHVPAGHRGAPLVPDHAAQHVQRRVGAHQLVTAVPVDLDG